ncbi:MAG: molybdopterin-dependent oxidoreductase, partial [Sciscionella sp.]|nr:molybdopterin-dependent oxidoreductase [Sciscionella sp.]
DDIVAAAAHGQLSGLVVGGVDPDDLADPALAARALAGVDFLVSLEMRPSAVTEQADVVLPIAPAAEKSGSYLNWEGRRREFGTTIDGTGALSDCRVLDTLAVEMDADLYTQTPAAAAADLAKLGSNARQVAGSRPTAEHHPAVAPGAGQAVLATWKSLLDNGSLQADEPHLAATAAQPRALLSNESAARYGVEFGQPVIVSTDRGSIEIVAAQGDLPDGVVWLPENSGPSTVRKTLGVGHGAVVNVRAGDASASDVNAGDASAGNASAGEVRQ